MRIFNLIRRQRDLSIFRSNLAPGDEVMVKFRNEPFKAKVYQSKDTYVTVYNDRMQFSSYPKGCIYPSK